MQFLATAHGNARLRSVGLRYEAHTGRLAVNNWADIGCVDRAFLLEDHALRTRLAWLEVLRLDVDTLDDDPITLVDDAEDLPDDALGGAAGHDDIVTLADVAWH